MTKNNNTISVSEHIENRLKPYSLYVIYERAIPSMVDGFKPGQRKAVYTASQVAKNKFIKTESLGGYSIPVAGYQHGPQSMTATISNMAAEYSNNLPILQGSGSFGSRLVQEASSPRYTSVKLHKNFDKVFVDNDILEYYEDPEHPEPRFYLPLVPTLLVNGASGIATGFATEIHSRSFDDVKEACIEYMETGSITNQLKPSFPDFDGKVYASSGDWYCEGLFEWNGKTQIEITELPIGFDREKYIQHLYKLQDEGIISSHKDRCSKKGFHFSCTLKRDVANKYSSDNESLIKKFKLRKKLNENITVIDQNESLRIYDSAEQLLKDFVDFRLGKYTVRYNHYIDRDEERMKFLKAKKEFIESVNEGSISVKEIKRSELVDVGVDFVKKQEVKAENERKYGERLADTPIQQFTYDSIEKIQDEIDGLERQIESWYSKDNNEEYKEDLNNV